jgi:multiple sugar transport system substrate-binding protein
MSRPRSRSHCVDIPDRRRFLASVGGSIAGLAVHNSVGGAAQFHVEVARKAKVLAGRGAQRLKILIPEGSQDNVVPIIDSFFTATGVSVEAAQAAVDDINAQLLLDAISDTGDYDLALPATFGLPDLVAAKAIIPLSDYALRHEPANFRQSMLYRTGDMFDGKLYGFQTDGDAYLMFYNRDLLDDPEEKARYEREHGIALAVPQTWDELDRQMAFFNRPEDGIYGGLLFRTANYLAWEWWVRFHAKGYWPLSKTLEPQINSAAGVEALEEMVRATRHLAPEAGSLGLFGNWDRYSQGDVYCNIGWGGSQKFFNRPNSSIRGKLAFGPTPGGIVDGELLMAPYFNWGWSFVVTVRSAQPELAYLFALYASTPEMSTVSVRQQGGYFDPFRTEHYHDSAIRGIYSEDFLDVHRQSLQSSIPDFYIASRGQYMQTLSTWLERAVNGSVTAKVALDRVAQHWALLNSRVGIQQQTQLWLRLRDRYPKSIRERLRDTS